MAYSSRVLVVGLLALLAVTVAFIVDVTDAFLSLSKQTPSSHSSNFHGDVVLAPLHRNTDDDITTSFRQFATSTAALPPTSSSVSSSTSKSSSSSSSSTSSMLPPAFLIERISTWNPPATERTFQTIADMCIPVFFDEQNNTNKGPKFLKHFKLRYLKNLQAADLRVRRSWYPDTNEMFLAYEVKLADDDQDNNDLQVNDNASQRQRRWRKKKENKSKNKKKERLTPLLLDLDQIYNLSTLRHRQQELQNEYRILAGETERKNIDDLMRKISGESEQDNFIKGDLLGFVEVTQKPYGLGFVESDGEEEYGKRRSVIRTIRPVLTNLAVVQRARKYGVGSKLVDACEKHVRNIWNMKEMVLEVEDYNISALKFYKKRGYSVLYSDPASRRYDLSGLFPEKVRCRREILRKVFGPAQSFLQSSNNVLNLDFFKRIRETVGR